MKKKGLVYRFTTLLGISIIAFQFGGEMLYAKYFRDERDAAIQQVSIFYHHSTIIIGTIG